MNIYAVMTIGGIFGMIAHALVAVNKINKRHEKATFRMVLQEYWISDKLAIITSIFSYLLILFVISEFVDLNHLEHVNNGEPLKERLYHFKLASFIKTFSVVAGYFSDSIVYGAMGVAEKRLIKRFKEQEDV